MNVWVVVAKQGPEVVALIKAFTDEGSARRYRDWCEAEVPQLQARIRVGEDVDHALIQHIGASFDVEPPIPLSLGNSLIDVWQP